MFYSVKSRASQEHRQIEEYLTLTFQPIGICTQPQSKQVSFSGL